MDFNEVADIFPMMTGAEYDALKADIAANGQLEAIWLHPDGSILDGRNRYRACCEIGVKPELRTYTGPLDTASLVQFVVSLNLKRRHLDSGQKAFVALEVERVLAEEAKERQGARTDIFQKIEKGYEPPAPIHAAEQAAQIVGTNRQYVTDAKRITEQAPDLAQAVKNGEMKITEAKRELKQRAKDQKLADVRESIELNQSPDLISGEISLNTIRLCAIDDLQLPAESVDMIFTDPPYHDEYTGLYGNLAQLAAHVLKPGGYLMAYVGKMFLPEVMAELSKHLEYVSIFAVFQPFSKARIMKHNIFENWRPIIAFKKTGRTTTKEWAQDVVRGNRDKEFHDWQQDEEAPRQYINAYTQPGDIVLDPFCGGGTTPYVCKKLGRYYLASDINEDAVKMSIARVNGNSSLS